MRSYATKFAATAFALALSACGSPSADKPAEAETATTETAPGDTGSQSGTTRPAAFAQCASCHSVEPGKHGVGPSLAGVYGTKSGEIAGYAFSEPMKQAGITWDDATLDSYLTSPMKSVPGTKMSYAGLSDPAKRKEVIDYLKTLK